MKSSQSSKEIHLVARPRGEPKQSDFAVVQVAVPDPGPGQVLIHNRFISVDPYMRGRMRDAKSYVPLFALATALPEISTGIAAIRMGDHQIAMSDVFGGNAFQVCLFLVADLVAGRAVLPTVGRANSWLAGVGIVLTVIYAAAVILRPQRRIVRLGIDSIVVVVLFAIRVIGLLAVVH